MRRQLSSDAGSPADRSASPRSSLSFGSSAASGEGDGTVLNADQLDQKLRRLKLRRSANAASGRDGYAGQRVTEHENALILAQAAGALTPRRALGFKVVKRANMSSASNISLLDFPNEVLTIIVSHLHPDSYTSVALVSKKFHALVTSPHAWQMAFFRYFPGQDMTRYNSRSGVGGGGGGRAKSHVRGSSWDEGGQADAFGPELRYFTRLSGVGGTAWRVEYLLRTRLIRSLTRGRPSVGDGGIGGSSRSRAAARRKASAVLTYASKLWAVVTHLDASFVTGGGGGSGNSRRAPRVLHGCDGVGIGSLSDPTSGKVDKWGLTDPTALQELDDVLPGHVPFGAGPGPAACPNVLDVSQQYGLAAGEGFPGGRVYLRIVGDNVGRFLGRETRAAAAAVVSADDAAEFPEVPEMTEAVSAIWIAKSSAVPAVTGSIVGMLVGSTLGVVSAYSIGYAGSGTRYSPGECTALWVLSPGVPIVAVKVDENYTFKRRSAGRVWAVALNALGEVYYLAETPDTLIYRQRDNSRAVAWRTGRTARWNLVEHSRRVARADPDEVDGTHAAFSPRSSSDAMGLSRDQLVAEAREIEKYLAYRPARFRKVCEDWDMRRRLEVDFGGDDGHQAGEGVFVISCGLERDQPAEVRRYVRNRSSASHNSVETGISRPSSAMQLNQVERSIFGSGPTSPSRTAFSTPAVHHDASRAKFGATSPDSLEAPLDAVEEWHKSAMSLKTYSHAKITASAIDMSFHAVSTVQEEQQRAASKSGMEASTPGRRSRMVGVGTNAGTVIIWNAREAATAVSTASDTATTATAPAPNPAVDPLRIVQTESPEISCLALSALYVVHGGSDGLAQAWDPLSSTPDPIRTLNSRSLGRVPRQAMNGLPPQLRGQVNCSAVRAIHLDPDPLQLRGILAFGAFLRYWTYSSGGDGGAGQTASRKRRLRHPDMLHGGATSSPLSRRGRGSAPGGASAADAYIAGEQAEARRESAQRAAELARFRARFGAVSALGPAARDQAVLTEDEAVRLAELLSVESFDREQELARLRARDEEDEVAMLLAAADEMDDDSSEAASSPGDGLPRRQGSSDSGATSSSRDSSQQPPRAGNSSGSPPFDPMHAELGSSPREEDEEAVAPAPYIDADGLDEDLALALRLSLLEEERRHAREAAAAAFASRAAGASAAVGWDDEFPPLGGGGGGEGGGGGGAARAGAAKAASRPKGKGRAK